MGRVVSLGSINVDRIRFVAGTTVAALEDRYEWFPERGQTVTVTDLPPEFAREPDSIRHGGKGANQAVAAARAGADAEMLGKVGPDRDRFGVVGALSEAGVGVDRIGTASAPTGTADIFVRSDGENWIVVRPGANGTVDDEYVRTRADAVRAADCLLLQNEVPTGPVVSLLSALAEDPERPTVVLDPGPTDGVETLLACEAVDYVVPNETEYRALRPSLEGFDGTVVRTRGPEDAVVEADRRFTVTPPTVDPVDTTGAGDVLCGFLAARLAAGDSLREAVEVGVTAGSLATRTEGARNGIPTLETVRGVRETGAVD